MNKNLSVDDMQNNTNLYFAVLKRSLPAETYEKFKSWSLTTDICSAPASTVYHHVYLGGLIDHSLGVLEWLLALNRTFNAGYSRESLARVALFHDLCKVGVYHTEKRNRKIDGRWQEIEEWAFVEDYPYGHGDKSVIRLVQLGIPLSDEEYLAIKHHMGPYNLLGNDLKTYQQASNDCNLVWMLHVADEANCHFGRKVDEIYGAFRKDEEVC